MNLDQDIKNFFDNKISMAPNLRSIELLGAARDLILNGGKRARPTLFKLTYIAYGGKNIDKLDKLILAIEIYHQFLLIHDDIIDKDTIRYDGPNITGHYLKEFADIDDTIPESMALLAGDLLYSFVYEIILKDNYIKSDQKVAILQLISEINEHVIYGQQLDTLNVKSLGSSISVDELLDIHAKKTALYSIKLPMRLAGILLHINHKECQNIDIFAMLFGIYFQLSDDHSDYFNNKSAFNNRPKYRDYKQGKITYPIMMGFELSDKKNQEFLYKNLGNKNLSKSSTQKVISTLESCGAVQKSTEIVNDYRDKTIEALNDLNIIEKFRPEFLELINNLQV